MSIILFSIFCSTSSYSQEVDFIQQLNDHKIDIKHANKFERILIQDDGGRIKPISTLASEYVRKISRKSHLFDNNASQILLGMMSNPRIWSQVPMIKISHPEIKLILEIEDDRVSFRSFFQEMGTEFNSFRPGLYKLDSSVQLAHSISPAKRSKSTGISAMHVAAANVSAAEVSPSLVRLMISASTSIIFTVVSPMLPSDAKTLKERAVVLIDWRA